jgi:hypothetical protein
VEPGTITRFIEFLLAKAKCSFMGWNLNKRVGIRKGHATRRSRVDLTKNCHNLGRLFVDINNKKFLWGEKKHSVIAIDY